MKENKYPVLSPLCVLNRLYFKSPGERLRFMRKEGKSLHGDDTRSWKGRGLVLEHFPGVLSESPSVPGCKDWVRRMTEDGTKWSPLAGVRFLLVSPLDLLLDNNISPWGLSGEGERTMSFCKGETSLPQTCSWIVMTEDSQDLEGAEVKLVTQGGCGQQSKGKVWRVRGFTGREIRK